MPTSSEPTFAAAASAEAAGVMQTFEAAFDAFNRADLVSFRRIWSEEVEAIINQAPPYIWTGRNAVNEWLAAVAGQPNPGVTARSISGGAPTKLEISGDTAFVVLPVELRFTQDGISMQERGTQVCVLARTPQGWRFKALAYGGEIAKPLG